MSFTDPTIICPCGSPFNFSCTCSREEMLEFQRDKARGEVKKLTAQLAKAKRKARRKKK